MWKFDIQDTKLLSVKWEPESEDKDENLQMKINTPIVVPDGVTYISSVFAYSYAKNIILPKTLRTIGFTAFYRTYNLESIIIPKSVTYISQEAFRLSERLTSVIFEDGGNDELFLCDRCFADCENLNKVILPNRSTTADIKIGDWAFESCNITDLIIPENVVSVGNSICPSIEHLTILSKKAFNLYDFINYSYEKSLDIYGDANTLDYMKLSVRANKLNGIRFHNILKVNPENKVI